MMELRELGGRRYAVFSSLAQAPGLVHAYSTRPEDVSVRLDARQVEGAARRAQMARDLGLSPERLSHCAQVHDGRVAVLRRDPEQRQLEGCDAVVTDVPELPVMTFSADCPLILLFDPGRRAVGLVHASWRCTVGQLAWRTIAVLRQEFGCRPEELLAGIGPGAGPCCYEVGPEVRQAATHSGLPKCAAHFAQRNGSLYFDLWSANAALLCAAGVAPEHIELAAICTMCRPDLFFSFRREKAGCGHFGLMAALSA